MQIKENRYDKTLTLIYHKKRVVVNFLPLGMQKARKSAVSMELSLEESVTAPVSRGQRLGTLTVKTGEQVLKEVPLVAAEGVERKSFLNLFGMVMRRAAMSKI